MYLFNLKHVNFGGTLSSLFFMCFLKFGNLRHNRHHHNSDRMAYNLGQSNSTLLFFKAPCDNNMHVKVAI